MKSLLYIGLAVVVLAAAGFGGYSIYKHYNAKENEVPKVYFTRDISPAGIDMVSVADGNEALMNRIAERQGLHTLEAAEQIGLGSRTYELVDLDK